MKGPGHVLGKQRGRRRGSWVAPPLALQSKITGRRRALIESLSCVPDIMLGTLQMLAPQSFQLHTFIPHFTGRETGSKMLSNMSKFMPLEPRRARLSMQSYLLCLYSKQALEDRTWWLRVCVLFVVATVSSMPRTVPHTRDTLNVAERRNTMLPLPSRTRQGL